MTKEKIKAMADETKQMTVEQAETDFVLKPNGHTMMMMKCLKAVGYYAYKNRMGKKIFVEAVS